jgi:hypothetical protein
MLLSFLRLIGAATLACDHNGTWKSFSSVQVPRQMLRIVDIEATIFDNSHGIWNTLHHELQQYSGLWTAAGALV